MPSRPRADSIPPCVNPVNPPLLANRRRIKRVSPLQAGKMLGLLYACLGLLFIPIFLVASIGMAQLPEAQRGPFALVGVGFALAAPVIYGVMGFIFGVISAALYNVAAKWIGGLEIEVE